MTKTLAFTVPGMSCDNCENAVRGAISSVEGVEEVVVDLDMKRVDVHGTDLDDASIRMAIDEAGYEAAS